MSVEEDQQLLSPGDNIKQLKDEEEQSTGRNVFNLPMTSTYLPTYLYLSIYLSIYLIIGLYFHVFAFTGATIISLGTICNINGSL
eukprot:COSAG05_NODE_596_length_8452_cov_10.143302_9_plen_85_part_00